MNSAIKRSILRWIHLFVTIPILSCVYGPPAQVQQYVGAVRFIFVPAVILSGLWMYLGAVFAIIGVAAWIGASYLSGFWPAVLSQVAVIVAWKIWLKIRARKSYAVETVKI